MNTDPCGGTDNENDGCGVIFTCRTLANGAHCSLCTKLKVPGLLAEAKVELKVPASLYIALLMLLSGQSTE
jgi:hypothetical protein